MRSITVRLIRTLADKGFLMANISRSSEQEVIKRRDKKARPHLEQYAPVWIVNETIELAEEAVQFEAVFQHPHATLSNQPAWVRRRYRYDSFNDTLYHKGQVVLDEDDVLDLMDSDPYIESVASDMPNSYGG